MQISVVNFTGESVTLLCSSTRDQTSNCGVLPPYMSVICPLYSAKQYVNCLWHSLAIILGRFWPLVFENHPYSKWSKVNSFENKIIWVIILSDFNIAFEDYLSYPMGEDSEIFGKNLEKKVFVKYGGEGPSFKTLLSERDFSPSENHGNKTQKQTYITYIHTPWISTQIVQFEFCSLNVLLKIGMFSLYWHMPI